MKNKKTINRVLQLIRPYTYLVVSILVLAAVTVAATLYSPILIGKGVDCMIEKGLVSFPDLKLVLLQLAVVTAISAISQWVMSLLTNNGIYPAVFRCDDDSRNTGIYDIHRWKNHADRGIDHAVIFFRGKLYRKTYIYHVPSAV